MRTKRRVAGAYGWAVGAAFFAALVFPAVTRAAGPEPATHPAASGLLWLAGAFLLIAGGELFYNHRRLRREKDERAHLEEIINNIPNGIGTFEFEGTRLVRGYLNDSYYRMLGTTREARGTDHISPETMTQVIHPDDLPGLFEELKRSQETNTEFSHHYRIVGTDGHYHWMAMQGRIVQRDGDHMTYLVTMQDEDELFRSHVALFESETILQTAIADTDMKAWVYDPKHRTATWVASTTREAIVRAQHLTDYPESVIAQGLIHPDDTGEFLVLHHRAENGDFSGEAVVRIAYENGWRWKKIRYSAVADAQGNFTKILGTSVPMEDYKELEDRMRVLMLQANVALAVYHIPERQLEIEYGTMHRVIEGAPESCVAQDLVHPEDVEKYLAFYRSFAAGKEAAETVLRCRGTTGHPFDWIKLAGTLVCDREGQPLRAITTGIDISAQQRTSQMYENELKFRDLLEAEAFWTITADLTANRVLEDWQEGKRQTERVSPLYSDVVPRIQGRVARDEYRGEIAALLEVESLQRAWHEDIRHLSMDYPRRTLKGVVKWTQLQVNLRRQPETNHLLVFLYGRDIDEEKRDRLARESLMGQQADFLARLDTESGQFRFLQRTPYLDALKVQTEAAYTYDAYVNAFLQLINDNPTFPEIRQALSSVATLQEYLEDNGDLEVSDWVVTGGQRRRKRLRVFYQDENRDTILFQQRDVTEIYQEESIRAAALSEALAQAQAASVAKSNFLSRMSHEIRTPMNAIIGLTALARQRFSEKDFVEESLGKIDTSAHYLLSLINDVLDISRIESGKMELDLQPGSLRALLVDFKILLQPRADEKGVEFSALMLTPLPETCLFDALKLKQILVNLVSNAIKFTPAGGHVDCYARLVKTENETATVDFTVTDTGIGIEKEFLPRIFEPFEQESAGNTTRYGGTGLGLAITKNLVELMGGTIEARSEKGIGSAFTATLPFRIVDEEAPAPVTVADDAVDFTGLRVLLAEDNEINREIATFILEDKGCEVVPAVDGQAALDRFLESPAGTFGLIFMDIRMPFLDGYGATRAIRASDHPDAKTVPIVAMTANAFEEDAKKAYDSGMNGYLTKPVEPHNIYQMVQQFWRKDGPAPS